MEGYALIKCMLCFGQLLKRFLLYSYTGYTDHDNMALKPINPDSNVTASGHPYEVSVHTMEEQPPPPGFETLPKEEELSKKPPLTLASNDSDEKTLKNDQVDSSANLPDTTDRKYLSEEENFNRFNKVRRSISAERDRIKERERSGKDHKKSSHSRHHHSEKRRDRDRDNKDNKEKEKEKDHESSTDDGKRDKKSKDKKKRKKSKETDKKKSKRDRKDKDKKDREHHHHHHHHKEKKTIGDESEETKPSESVVEPGPDSKDIPATVSNTNENSMEALDLEQIPSSTTLTLKETEEVHLDTNTPDHLPESVMEPETCDDSIEEQKEQGSPIHFNRSDSVLDIYTNLDFDAELEDDAGPHSPQKSELPELSKWERDDDTQIAVQEKNSEATENLDTSANDSSKEEKVTNEVIKRAEHAIFARAISAIRPLEIKKVSADRQKLYLSSGTAETSKESSPGFNSGSSRKLEPNTPELKTETVQITVPAHDESGVRSVEIKTADVQTKSKISPIRTSVKDRLGIKIVEKKRSRTRSRSRTPKRKLMSTTATRSAVVQKKRSASRSKSKERSGRDYKSSRDERGVGRRERDKDDKAGRSYDRMRDTKRNQDSKHGVRGSRRSSSDRRPRNQSRERDARPTSRKSKSPQGPPISQSQDKRKNPDETKSEISKKSSTTVDSSNKTRRRSRDENLSVKKRNRSTSSASSRSDSDSSSTTDSDASLRHHKKHNKKSKKKNRASSTESDSKRKKLKKNKKSVKKKKKSKK
jgi:E3 ubiquitin-protein ligase RBBP6